MKSYENKLISIFLSLSSYHEEALCVGRIQTRMGVAFVTKLSGRISCDFFNLLLAGFHQADIIIVKHLIQGRNNETRLGVESLTLR